MFMTPYAFFAKYGDIPHSVPFSNGFAYWLNKDCPADIDWAIIGGQVAATDDRVILHYELSKEYDSAHSE